MAASAVGDPPTAPRRVDRSDGAAMGPGEAKRFRDEMLPHMDAAYSFARFLTRDATLAEDVVQEAFLRAFRSFAGYRGGRAKAWLFAVVRSTFLSMARGRKGEAVSSDMLEEAPDDRPTPEGMLLREAADAQVRAAVDALPEPFREAIVLRELEDMSYKEVSEITGAPIGTVMSRLARARKMLAAALVAEGVR